MRMTAIGMATALAIYSAPVAQAQQRPTSIEILPVRGQLYLLASKP